jgi:predicted metal-dependent hydrolase
MRVDTGKSAKRSGAEHPKDARKVDQDPLHVPPHKKPRRYRLELKYETVTHRVLSKEFTSKVEMQAFRLRVEAWIAQRKAEQLKQKPSRHYFGHWASYDLKMEEEEKTSFKQEPEITEQMIEGAGVKR